MGLTPNRDPNSRWRHRSRQMQMAAMGVCATARSSKPAQVANHRRPAPLFDTQANVFIPLGVALLLIGLMTWFSPLVNRLYYRAEEAHRQRESSRR